jgi:hypothetical protein
MIASKKSARHSKTKTVSKAKKLKKQKGQKPPKIQKRVLFDLDQFDQLGAASSLLGLDDMGFIRLAVHKAIQNVLYLYRETIEASARKLVDDAAYIYFKSPVKKDGEPRLQLENAAEREKLKTVLDKIYPSQQDIDLALAKRKQHPLKTLPAFSFPGDSYEQTCTELLLGSSLHVRAGRSFLRLELEEYFKSCVALRVERWKSLVALQAQVSEKVFGDPGKTSTIEQDLTNDMLILTQAEDELLKTGKLSNKSAKHIQKRGTYIWKKWPGLTDADKFAELKNWKNKLSKHFGVRAKNRKIQADRLDALKTDRKLWLDPERLLALLAPEGKSILKPERPFSY